MTIVAVLICLSVSVTAYSLPHPRISGQSLHNFPLISREEWNANPALGATTNLNTPVPFVVIHHSYQPGACNSTDECMRAMRSMQNYHQFSNGWVDIGYNFAVGSDGHAYEGRGWNAVGAHAFGYNTNSIGIVQIGDWRSTVPPAVQLKTTKQLIEAGVRMGIISPDYKLIGHRQVKSTECPGDALFSEISTWDHFESNV
ncbi:peptidoglycan-recognition protein LB-like [Nymphalis io]|uniref:peptidoglycan-recognition protein LB-like n=1 Tax=Inachis io TaxID=171585 RepID=UPI0021681B6C|nr:peptidoglycan-recognition protein LB-like [Nymphalis io]